MAYVQHVYSTVLNAAARNVHGYCDCLTELQNYRTETIDILWKKAEWSKQLQFCLLLPIIVRKRFTNKLVSEWVWICQLHIGNIFIELFWTFDKCQWWRCVTAPSVPVITGYETGEDFVNVTWSPTSEDSSEDPSDNPGHKFAIEYKKHG